MSDLTIDGVTVKIEGTILDTVVRLNKNPDSYLYLISGRPIPMDLVPEDDQKIDAIRVASGG